jgi:hypothetical protein
MVPYTDRSTAPPNWGELFQRNRTDVLADDPDTASQVQLSPEWLSDPSGSPANAEGVSQLPEGVPATSEGAPIDRTPESASSESLPNLDGGLSTPFPDDRNTAPGPPDSTHATPLVPSAAIRTSSEIRQGWNPDHTHNTRFRARLQAHQSSLHLAQTLPRGPDITLINQHACLVAHMETIQGLADGSTNYMHPTAYIAEAKDTVNYGKMLKSNDWDKFVTAMQNKVDGLRDILHAIPRTTLPEGHKAFPVIWAFKRKRNPDWSIAKWKACLNVHGGRQRYGINYWDTLP